MEVFDGHRALFRPLVTPAIAIGNFDGVHAGHRALLDAAVAAAAEIGGDAVALTFDPHPTAVLAPDRAPSLICGRSRRLELIGARGIDAAVVEPFTNELAATSPEAFVADILLGVMGARHIVVGYDFTYGHKAGGNIETLRAAGAERGFAVEVVDPVEVGGAVASSTEIRARIAAGDLAAAAALLGRFHDVDGVVVEGAKRGRELGFPTANLEVPVGLLPPAGIYATRVAVLDGNGGRYAAATSLGTNPTFGENAPLSFEAHLLDFDGDLYGKRLRVELVESLRPEKRFSDIAELVSAIEADVVKTREIIGGLATEDA